MTHPEYTDVMLDIETMGTAPTAPVVTIGLVYFNMEDHEEDADYKAYDRSFYARLDPDTQINRQYDFDTIKWWMDQNVMARAEITEKPLLDTREVLRGLEIFIGDNPEQRLWANSPSFDCNIMWSLYESLGGKFPFPFWNWRDYRTIKSLVPKSVYAHVLKGVEHNALDDAIYQIRVLQACMEHLNGSETGSAVRQLDSRQTAS